MASFDDYEIVKILSGNFHSACYKVKEKKTSELKVLRVLPYDEANETIETLIAKISERTAVQVGNIITFDNYIIQDETKTLYVVTEYCRLGSLHDIIDKCLRKDVHLKEEFLWNLLYKVAFSLKHNSELHIEVDITKIYVDSLFNVKFYCLNLEKRPEMKSEISNPMAKVFLQLCTLNVAAKESKIPNHYSDSIRNIIQYLHKTELKQSFDTVLWHPMVSSNRAKKFQSGIFIPNHKRECAYNKTETDSIINTNLEDKADSLRKKEMSLQMRESRLKQFERRLSKREKKVTVLEKVAKEKMAQAELYLKRIKNQKYNRDKKDDVENLNNSSSVDYCDSIIVTTSNKLANEHVNKNRFSRSLSERRVKFKGHSPLKALQNLHHNSKLSGNREMTSNKSKTDNSDKSHLHIKSDKEGCNLEKANRNVKCKKRFSLIDMFTKKCTVKDSDDTAQPPLDLECFQPIVWTEENKRQAFNLLRIMNSESSSASTDEGVKHTNM